MEQDNKIKQTNIEYIPDNSPNGKTRKAIVRSETLTYDSSYVQGSNKSCYCTNCRIGFLTNSEELIQHCVSCSKNADLIRQSSKIQTRLVINIFETVHEEGDVINQKN